MDTHHKAIADLLCKGKIQLSFQTTRDLVTLLMTLRTIYYNYDSTKLSPRAIHHYIKEEVIDTSDGQSKGRRRFNFFQILWLNLLENLRTLGYPLKDVKVIKSELLDKTIFDDQNGKFNNLINFSAFEFIVSMAMLSDNHLNFIAMNDGRYGFVSDDAIPIYTMEEEYLGEPHIFVPLSKRIQYLINTMPTEGEEHRLKVDFSKPIYRSLNVTEKAILKDVWKGEYASISIAFKGGKISRLVLSQTLKSAEKVGDILKKSEYQKITLTTKSGKVVTLKNEEEEGDK